MIAGRSVYRLLLLLAAVLLESNTFVVPFGRSYNRVSELQNADLPQRRTQMAENDIFANPSEYAKVSYINIHSKLLVFIVQSPFIVRKANERRLD